MSAASFEISPGRLIQDGAHAGEFNMAADVYLSEEAGRSGQIILRFYAWDQPTLSLGFHQRFSQDLWQSYTARGIPIVRRPTGGRAVLHDQELTYCLAMPAGNRLMAGGKDKLQVRIGSAFIEAGRMIGLQPQLVRRGFEEQGALSRLSSGSPLCFDSVSRWEVRLDGRKWIGSAQRIFPYAYLQHGSILLTNSMDSAELRIALAQAFEHGLHLSWQAKGWTASEIAQIGRNFGILNRKETTSLAS